MIAEINTAYSDFQNLVEDDIYSMDQINWWLLKHENLFKQVSSANNTLCSICLEGMEEDLPYDCFRKPYYCTKRPEFGSFIGFWEELDKVTQLHKLEYKCMIVLNDYDLLVGIEGNLRDWVVKNYNIFEQIEAYFFEHMEFSDNGDKSFHIVEVPELSFGVTVREADFKNAIRFYDVFFDLYYNKKLYPEKMQEWDQIFKAIQSPKNEL